MYFFNSLSDVLTHALYQDKHQCTVSLMTLFGPLLLYQRFVMCNVNTVKLAIKKLINKNLQFLVSFTELQKRGG